MITSEKVMGFKGFGGGINAGVVLGYTSLIYVVARVDAGKKWTCWPGVRNPTAQV